MTWWQYVLALYVLGVWFTAGALWADERRSNDWPVGLVDWLYWAGSWALASLAWPVLVLLAGRGRPTPPSQPRGTHHG